MVGLVRRTQMFGLHNTMTCVAAFGAIYALAFGLWIPTQHRGHGSVTTWNASQARQTVIAMYIDAMDRVDPERRALVGPDATATVSPPFYLCGVDTKGRATEYYTSTGIFNTLIQNGMLDASLLVSLGVRAPDDLASWSANDRARWIRNNAQFVLVPPRDPTAWRFDETATSDTLLLVQRPEFAVHDKVCTMTVDGTWISLTPEQAEARVEAQSGRSIDELRLQVSVDAGVDANAESVARASGSR